MALGKGKGSGIGLPGLQSAREGAGYSMRELEAESGVSRSTIYRLETCEHGARSRTVRSLAEVLVVPVQTLTRSPVSGDDPASGGSPHAFGVVSKEDFEFAKIRAAAEDISADEALGRMLRERAERPPKSQLWPREEMPKIAGEKNAAAAVLADRR